MTIYDNPDTVHVMPELLRLSMQRFTIPTRRQKPPHPHPATQMFRDVNTSDTSPIGGISAAVCDPAANKIKYAQMLAANTSNSRGILYYERGRIFLTGLLFFMISSLNPS